MCREVRPRTGANPTAMPVPLDIDFIITNDLQFLEMWYLANQPVNAGSAVLSEAATRYRRAVLVPICGNAVQRHGTIGVEPDGFTFRICSVRFAARARLTKVTVTGWLPELHGGVVDITVAVASSQRTQPCQSGRLFTIEVPVDVPNESEGTLAITLSSSFRPCDVSESTDDRNLGCLIQAIEFT
jgi:hypothetical protein